MLHAHSIKLGVGKKNVLPLIRNPGALQLPMPQRASQRTQPTGNLFAVNWRTALAAAERERLKTKSERRWAFRHAHYD